MSEAHFPSSLPPPHSTPLRAPLTTTLHHTGHVKTGVLHVCFLWLSWQIKPDSAVDVDDKNALNAFEKVNYALRLCGTFTPDRANWESLHLDWISMRRHLPQIFVLKAVPRSLLCSSNQGYKRIFDYNRGGIWSVHFKQLLGTQEDTPKTNEDKQAFSAPTPRRRRGKGADMSGGEVVCSGWLRKSPPEKS
ncbi:hypothetical protein WMY93_006949 [Mugilogobius chulae]|uniref:Uncharacterized protein n=1 Tax=Mugilogobius chulae TaxID=88201 RepID=A0AAW0PPR9_9GOBI